MTVEFPETRLSVNSSFAALVCLMLIFCEKRIVLISLFCSLCHEMGHIIFMYMLSSVPEKITLDAFGMSIDRKNEVISYKHEALISMGGIVINLFMAVSCFLMYNLFGKEYFFETAVVNLLIAAVNSVPVGMLDFAGALECVLLAKYEIKKAQEISDAVSVVSVIAFSVFCIVYCVFIKLNISLVAVTLYLLMTYKKRS